MFFSIVFIAYECQSNEFRCDDGLCFDRNLLCDGIRHCPDGGDESNCRHDQNHGFDGKFFLSLFFSFPIILMQFIFLK